MRIVKKILKVLGYVVGVILVLILLALVFVYFAYPKSEPPPEMTVAGTPEQVERGRYLFHNVSTCVFCHSVKNDAGEVIAGGLGKENWDEWAGHGAPFFPPNITPAALGDWTDGEVARAISSGIRKDGRALFPAMPYENYRNLSRPDLEALVAYVRTLPPIPVEHAREKLGFPFSLIARLMPRPAHPVERAPVGGAAGGEYLTSIMGCQFCHGKTFSGGDDHGDDDWIIRSANLTPDSATGLGTWTRERFVTRFRGAAGMPNTVPVPGGGQGPRSPMPWAEYSQITEEDLGAIYDFLRTVEPVRQAVVRVERRPEEE